MEKRGLPEKFHHDEAFVDIAFLMQVSAFLQEKRVRLPENCSPFLRAIAERIWENRRNTIRYKSRVKQDERRPS